jgi:DNA polymerase-3 subunit delta
MPAKKATSSSPIWFVTGSEESEVKKQARTLAAELAPGDDPFSTEIIDGAVATVDEALTRIGTATEALLTMPLFGGDKLVWLKNATFLADSVVGRSEAVAQAVQRLLDVLAAGLPDGMKFLFSAPEADKRRTAYKTLAKIARTSIHDKPDFGWNATEADVVAWVVEKATARGVHLTEEAAEVLAARVGPEARRLDSELEKLSLQEIPPGGLDEKMVRALVPATRQGGIFDLSNHLLRRDLPAALETMDQLLRQKESALGLLLAAIVPTLRNLLLVSDLMATHGISPPAKAQFFGKSLERLPPQATAHLPRKKDGSLNTYPLGLAAAASRRYTPAELRAAFLKCSDLNRSLVTTSLDERLLLGKFLLELLAPADA